MNAKAIGLIEVYGLSTAIVVADSAVKASEIKLIGLEMIKGGLVTVKLQGDIAEIAAALDAVKKTAEKFNIPILTHKIPRIDEGVSKLLISDTYNLQEKTIKELKAIASELQLYEITPKKLKSLRKAALIKEIQRAIERRND